MSKKSYSGRKMLSFMMMCVMIVQLAFVNCYAADPDETNDAKEHKKVIGVLTSGGDAPGMNAIIRSVTRAAIASDMKVIGIRHGYEGLLRKDVVELDLRSVSGIIQRGGTMLYTARSSVFATSEGVKRAAENCRELGIEGIVVAGGDGSFRGARDLTEAGIPCIGIPATIDNDICCSEYTIGFDTAANTAIEMIDKIRDTAQSHDRCSVIEVMGRNCGDVALYSGVAAGATAIIVPEVEFNFERDIIARIEETKKTGKNHFIILLAEGVGGADKIAKAVQEATGIESRATVLGHVIRGGSPSLKDRVVASEMGVHAVNLLEKGQGNRVVVMKDGKIIDLDITDALNLKKEFDKNLYDVALKISI